LRAITRRNALDLSDARWRYDIGRLVSALEDLLAKTTAVHVTPATPDVTAAIDASTEAAPTTGQVQRESHAADLGRAGRRRHGRLALFAGVAALIVVGLGVVLIIGALGGGSGSGGKPSVEFTRFDAADNFTVDVPTGWKDSVETQQSSGDYLTTLKSPDQGAFLGILQEPPTTPPEDRAKEAEREHMTEGSAFHPIQGPGPPQPVGNREAVLFAFEHVEKGYGPATVYTYFFNAGDYGWRTRAVAAESVDGGAELAKAIATRMAETLQSPHP
jgi:hypothetical protein